jgi:hypothetical protein
VPHDVATPPNPKATRALLDKFAAFLGVPIDLTDLDIAAAAWERSVGEVVAGDADVQNYVEKLEERFDHAGELDDTDDDEVIAMLPDLDDEDDEDDEFDEDDLPSGDSLAADFERYLREHGDGRD